MLTIRERQHQEKAIRNEFRQRYDEYVIGPVSKGGRDIQHAVEKWRRDNQTSEPLFTREMWETIAGAVYPTPAELVRQREDARLKLKTKIRSRVRGLLYGDRIAIKAYELMWHHGYQDLESAIQIARKAVYQEMDRALAREAAGR